MSILINKLEEIGFSKNEAKVYVSLLKKSGINGYEISKQSGVPRSMVYSVISKLIEKKSVFELRTDPPTYSPISVKKLINNYQQKTQNTLEFLESELKVIEQPAPYNVIKNIEGKTNIIEAFNVLISQAEEEVWLSIWDNEIDELQQAAEAQVNKGVQLFSMLFTDVETSSFGKAFYHKETSEVEHNRMEQRLSIVVQDDNEVIIAGFLEGKIPQAIQSHEPMLILLAKEYIRHDMMIKVVDDSIDKQTFDALCSKDKLINYIINNK